MPPLLAVWEVKRDLCFFSKDHAFPNVWKNKEILLSISKPCLQRHWTYIQLIRDKSPSPRELTVKIDERMEKSSSIILFHIYIYIWKQRTEEIGHLPRLQGKPVNTNLNLILHKSQSSVTKPLVLPKLYIKETPPITKKIANQKDCK